MSLPTENNLEVIGEGEGFADELCDMIEGAQLFQDMPHAEIRVMASYARAYQVAKGKAIFREGQKGSFMCILTEGKVDILKESDSKERKHITTIRPGKTMGEMAMLDELPHSATAVAADTVKLVMITKMNFEKLTEEHPVLAVKLLKKLARLMSLRLRQTTGILLDYLS